MSKSHVQVWSGSLGVNVIDMTNAGKSGKTCRQYYFRGDHKSNEAFKGYHYAKALLPEFSYSGIVDHSYEEIVAKLEEIVTDAKFIDSPYDVSGREDTIRGVDAPLPILEFTREGKFSVSIDKDGVHLVDHVDQHNLPRVITIRQKGRIAYNKAKAVWDKVIACETFSAAWTALSEAGCSLHHYCAMD